MSLGQNIKKIREDKNLTQQQIAELIHMHRSNYSKIESGQREISVDALNKVARYFGMTIDQIVNFDGAVPQEITVEDKTLMEQVKMIQVLEPEEKTWYLKWWILFLPKRNLKTSFRKMWLHYKQKARQNRASYYSYMLNK